MNPKLPSQAYKCLASYSRVSTAQACRIYQVVGTGKNCYGPELDQQSYNNLSMHTHELIMQRPLSLESLSSEPTLSWLEHTVHVTVWTCSCGQLPISPSMSGKQICPWFPSICPACSFCSMTIYILSASHHSHDRQPDPGISVQAQPLWYRKVILPYLVWKKTWAPGFCIQWPQRYQPMPTVPASMLFPHMQTYWAKDILPHLVTASCISNGWRSQSQENMKF